MNLKKRYCGIDIFKIVCAFLVVTIHISPWEMFGEIIHFYMVDVCARIAVPFFFASTGFFLFAKISFREGRIEKTKENRYVLLAFLKRIVILYMLWSMIYLAWILPYYFSIGYGGISAIKDYIM